MAREGISRVVDCVFCNIVKGFAPATVVLQDDEFVAFEDLFPKASTHVLVVPRAHHTDLDAWVAGAAPGASDRMLAFVGRVTRQLGVDGRYRLISNVGSDAGQIIFHQHWHVLAGELRAF
ncbi:MAG: HIT domain-containing protein [Thermoleophilia bacterium]|nr:HIT domain-containing protein [Thermoleophilia bacterium]